MASKFKALVLGCGLYDYYSQFSNEQLEKKRRNLWVFTLASVLLILSMWFVMDLFFSFTEKERYFLLFSLIALYPGIEVDRRRRVKAIKRVIQERS